MCKFIVDSLLYFPGGAPKLIYSAGSNIISYDMKNDREQILVSDGSEEPVGVDYHYLEGKIFWADAGHGKVRILIYCAFSSITVRDKIEKALKKSSSFCSKGSAYKHDAEMTFGPLGKKGLGLIP